MSTEAPALHRASLRFRDAALEAAFVAAEGSRSVSIMRYTLLVSAVMLILVAVLLDAFVPVHLRGDLSMKLLALFGCLMMAVGYAASYTAPVQRHAQWAVATLCVLFAAAVGSALRHLPLEFVTHRGFMFLVLHLFNLHALLRLRFVPAAVAGALSLAGYAIPMQLSGLLSPENMARHLFWLSLANGWGMGICYVLDLTRRREFAARLALEHERARSERLLLNILPAPIAARLKDSHEPIADLRENVTVLFADIVGFTPLAARKAPAELVALLDRVFSEFDTLAQAHGLEKIKTIGDAYMAAASLPQEQPDHALRAARMAVAILDAVQRVADETGERLQVRVGLHTGPVVAGVIGSSKFSYDLWGDTVNTASRMESFGIPGEVHCSAATAACLGEEFVVEARGPIEVKGKGAMETFLVGPAPRNA